MTTNGLKVLIVDDSDAYRIFLSQVVADIEGVEAVTTASGGRVALAKLKQMPIDLILLDIEMPYMDGIQTLERIKALDPDVGVIMVSAFHGDGTRKVIKALEMGALDLVSKAELGEDNSIVLTLRRRLMTLIGLHRARRNTRITRQLARKQHPKTAEQFAVQLEPFASETGSPVMSGSQVQASAKPFPIKSKIEVVAIGVSTGGPNALTRVIPHLPMDLGVPILLIQHMPAALTASLAESLDKKSVLSVREAVEGEQVLPNTVYVAPGGMHMTVTRNSTGARLSHFRQIRLNDDPPVNSCRPSLDVLLQSLRNAYDASVLAVIMTGMGNDGTEGVRLLKSRECYCLSQSEESCVVYGMPRSVDEAGLSNEQVPLDHMADRIVELVKGHRGTN